MSTTMAPTPGDLSARHAATLQTMIHQSDDGAICICAECRALKAAIAALSALPAAGGAGIGDTERQTIETLLSLAYAAWCLADNTEDSGGEGLTVERSDFAGLEKHLDSLDALPDDQPGYTMGEAAKARWALRRLLATTPQPSAAEAGWGPSYKQSWQAQADAAVGAQGEGAWVLAVLDETIRKTEAAMPTPLNRHGESSEHPVHHAGRLHDLKRARAVVTTLLSAAPAAGKGVDFDAWHDAKWPEPEQYGHKIVWRQRKADRREAWQAALTRQPVAGDGVNGRAWKVGDRVIWTSRFGKPFAGTVTCVRDPIPVRYEVELDDGALCDPLGHELTAAPAATPTDGGEGNNA